jgi:hypothetical protein
MTPQEEIANLLLILPHKLKVRFALYCARDVFHLVEDKNKEVAKACIDTVALWLKGKATAEECRAATHSIVINVFYHTSSSNAVSAVWFATYTTVSSTVWAATYSIFWTYTHSARAIAYTDKHTFTEIIEKYLSHLKTMINELTPIEKVLYNLEGK